MKCRVLFFLLVSTCVWSQDAPNPTMRSKVPELTFERGVAGNGTYYRYPVHNTSGRAVSRVAIIIVPQGVPEKRGEYLCDARCAGSGVDDLLPGDAKDFFVSTSQADAMQALVIEAALFEDGTYGGDEQSAAMIATQELGTELECKRIANFIERNLANPDTTNLDGIRTDLSKLPDTVDAETIERFKRRFPNLPDRLLRWWGLGESRTFVEFISVASVAEKRVALDYMNQFVEGKFPPDETLTQWWQWVKPAIGCQKYSRR